MDLVEGVCGIRSPDCGGGIFSWKKSGNRKGARSILICDVCHHHGPRRYFSAIIGGLDCYDYQEKYRYHHWQRHWI